MRVSWNLTRIRCRSQADVSLKGYDKHKQAKDAPPPLTSAEIEKEIVRKLEVRRGLGQSPVTSRAKRPLRCTTCVLRRVTHSHHDTRDLGRQTGVDIGASTKRQLVAGVAFPLVDEARAQLGQLLAGAINYVQLVRMCHAISSWHDIMMF